MKFTCQRIVLLLSVTTFVWPHWLTVISNKDRYSTVGCTVYQTWLAFVSSVILLCYWNEDKIDDQGSYLRHDDLLILGRNAAFCLAIDRLGLVSYQAEHSIPPSDRQIIMSKVWAMIIL